MADVAEISGPNAAKPSESWKRIRVGMAGVAGMLLLLALGSAMLVLEGQNSKPTNVTASLNSVEKPSEPMAELGVAPGAAEPAVPTK